MTINRCSRTMRLTNYRSSFRRLFHGGSGGSGLSDSGSPRCFVFRSSRLLLLVRSGFSTSSSFYLYLGYSLSSALSGSLTSYLSLSLSLSYLSLFLSLALLSRAHSFYLSRSLSFFSLLISTFPSPLSLSLSSSSNSPSPLGAVDDTQSALAHTPTPPMAFK